MFESGAFYSLKSIGAAMTCYGTAVEYAKTRVQFHGKPIGSHQLVQQSLVEMLTEITKAQFTTLQISRLKEEARSSVSIFL